VSLVADRASPVRLTFGPGQVLIEAQTEGRARAVETVPADFRGDEPVIAFNPHYLLDGLVAAAVPGQPRPHAGDPGGTGSGREGDAGPSDPASADPASADPADPGLLRIEFTSPAKPALITRVSSQAGPDGAPEEPGTAEFRYLVVPLRAAVRS
jgi:hypothetical protein